MKSKPKTKSPTKPSTKHRFHERDLPRSWHRNADAFPDDVANELLIPAPIFAGPTPGTPESSSMAMIPYNPGVGAAPTYRAPSPRASLGKRTAAAARAKAAALKPEVVNPINKAHLLGVAANAGGGVAASLAAREFGDNVGEKNLAIGLTALGALGSVFLGDHWQRVAQGVLGAGMGQLSGAYLADRADKKLAKEHKLRADAERAAIAALAAVPLAPPPAGKPAVPPRNAYGYDGTDLYGGVDRAQRAVDAMLADDARNGHGMPYGDGSIDVELMEAYAA